MEEDFPSNHTSRKLAILDLQVWVHVIYFEHYTKPMSSRAVVMAQSAFPPAMKKNILLEDGSRRLRNCSPSLPWDAKAKYLNTFCLSMQEAGHSESYRIMIITSVLARYESSLANHINGTRRVYRSRYERKNSEEAKKKSSKTN